MVATLLRLKLALTVNTLKRSPLQAVLAIIAMIYGAGALAVAIVGLVLLALAPTGVAAAVIVTLGSAAVLVWWLLPLLVTGIDQTLEPARLAAYPIPLRSLLAGLTLCGIVGVPGIVTVVAALATGLAWRGSGAGVAVAALVSGAVGALIAIVGSRAVAAAASGLTTHRRWREVAGIVLLAAVMVAGPALSAVSQALSGGAAVLPSAVRVLAVTPLGAAWAVPAALAAGDTGGALIRAAVALATLAVLVVVWRTALARALVTLPRPAAARRRSGLGMLGRVPDSPVGAVAARCLAYWFRDPRYVRQLAIVPLMPLLIVFWSAVVPFGRTGVLLAMGPVVAVLLGAALIADVSYDGTAFALHLASGVPGRVDRAGRAAALLTFAVPLVIVVTIVSAAVSGQWRMLPAVLGLALGALAGGAAIASVTSALLVYPVPAPGSNPFTARQGGNLIAGLSVYGVIAGVGVLSIPEIVLLIVSAVSGSAVVGVAGLVVGVALGGGLLVAGVRRGGRVLDARGPELLGRLAVHA